MSNTYKMPRFARKTIDVINDLKTVLEKKSYFPTLGHFYREIEILKFPDMKDNPYQSFRYSNPSHGRNVYAGQQYNTIVDYCLSMGWVTITNKNLKTYHVNVNPDIENMKATFIQIKASGPYNK